MKDLVVVDPDRPQQAPQLAPNGIPYPEVDAQPTNEWARRSEVLRRLPEDRIKSLHPYVVARPKDGAGGGMGLFTLMGIRKGEVVWAERAGMAADATPALRSRAWIEALPAPARKAYCHYMYKTGDDEFQSLAEFNELHPDEYPFVRTKDISNYMNHSCDPTCLFVDGGEAFVNVMVAARDLTPWEELSFDYCTSEDGDLSPCFDCRCTSAACRGRVTPEDWKQPALQLRFKGHFLPHVVDKISQVAGPEATAPLQHVHVTDTWWQRVLAGEGTSPSQMPAATERVPAHRLDLLARAARGPALDQINRQAAALLAHHRLRVEENEELGKYLIAGVDIAEGDIALLLPPNLLLWESEVGDFNRVLQICTTDRLFSSSVSEWDLDNYLSHSCEPNCAVEVASDLTVAIVAKRDIRSGESVTFDYDSTEDDLRDARGGFECNCGAAACRGMVLGRLYAPKPAALPPAATIMMAVMTT